MNCTPVYYDNTHTYKLFIIGYLAVTCMTFCVELTINRHTICYALDVWCLLIYCTCSAFRIRTALNCTPVYTFIRKLTNCLSHNHFIIVCLTFCVELTILTDTHFVAHLMYCICWFIVYVGLFGSSWKLQSYLYDLLASRRIFKCVLGTRSDADSILTTTLLFRLEWDMSCYLLTVYVSHSLYFVLRECCSRIYTTCSHHDEFRRGTDFLPVRRSSKSHIIIFLNNDVRMAPSRYIWMLFILFGLNVFVSGLLFLILKNWDN